VRWQTYAIRTGLTLAVALGAPAVGAGLSDLPTSQQGLANCMLTAASRVRGVSGSRLRFSEDTNTSESKGVVQTFLDYKYYHRDPRIHPGVTDEEVTITDLLSRKTKGLVLGGHVPDGNSDLDDYDSGMLSIVDAWNKECGLGLLVITA